ncbi:hypothetical protein PMI12_02167 [Variovorax sp. CF313]|nr:hypothetical protein PMI12_02167 [Variovorax sp. CF313]
MLRRVFHRGLPLRHAPARRQVAVDQVVRGGLVGHEVGLQAAGLRALHEFGQDVGGIAEQRDRHRFLRIAVLLDEFERVVDVARLLVDVACAQAEVDARLLALDVERDGARQRGRQRLRAAHAAEAGREDPLAREAVVVVLAAGFDEGFEGALHDALAADVDPAARGHLAVHEEALAVELVEVLPVGPLRHEVRVGQQHARCVLVRLEHADRLARLDEQRLVVVQLFQRREDLVVAGPVARGAADAAVHHQVLRALGDLGVEVVLQHAERGFGEPALAVELGAARGADHAGRVMARVGTGGFVQVDLVGCVHGVVFLVGGCFTSDWAGCRAARPAARPSAPTGAWLRCRARGSGRFRGKRPSGEWRRIRPPPAANS